MRVPSALRFGIVGSLGTLGFFVVFWGLPSAGLPSLATMITGTLYVAVVAYILLKITGNGASWRERHH